MHPHHLVGIADVILVGQLPNMLNLTFHGLLAAVCVAGLTSKRPRAHHTLAVGSACLFTIYIATLFARLG